MKIVTLTLNPAFDIHCTAEHFEAGHENLADVASSDAGGKGVNISRALAAYGTPCRTVAVLGEENGQNFLSALRSDGLAVDAVFVPGRIRENITIHPAGQSETRISFRGFPAGEGLLAAVDEKIGEIKRGDILTLTGRNPDGLPIGKVKGWLQKYKAAGVKIVIDSRSFALSDLLDCKPWLIKPNEEEIALYTGRTVTTPDDAKAAARDLRSKGIANVMISLGGAGAVLSCDGGEYFCPAPKIKPLSTIGAGDSSIAGFLSAVYDGESPEGCLSRAVAFGSAACLTPGTRPPKKEDIVRFLI